MICCSDWYFFWGHWCESITVIMMIMVTTTFYCRFVSRIQPTKQRLPKKGIKPKISISTNTFPLYFLPFLLLNTTSNLGKYTSKTRNASAKKHQKNPVFYQGFPTGPWETHPPTLAETTTADGTSPKTAFTAASPAAATALGPVMTSEQPVTGHQPGGKKSIQ